MFVQFPLKSGGLADKNDLKLIEIIGRHNGAFDNDLRGVIPAHSV
jgi:hypothetical protein